MATFIRKRDPRYKSHLANQQKATAAKASARSSGQSTPRKQTRSAGTFIEQDWQKTSRSQFDDADLEWAAAENGDDAEEWECVACGKTFRSEAAWDSHERSKKHMQAVERLKREMLEEDEELGLETEDIDGAESDEDNEEDSSGVAEEPTQSLEPESDKIDGISEEQEDIRGLDEEEGEGSVKGGPQTKSRKKKKAKKQSRAPSPEPLTKSARRAQARRAPSPISSVPAEPAKPSQNEHTEEPEVQSAARVESDAAEKFEISKRDKRRAREAVKKAKEDQDNNTPVVRLISLISGQFANSFGAGL